MHFDISVAVWVLAGAYAIYQGIKKYKNKDNWKMYKYTKESFEKFSKLFGTLLIVLGALLLFGALCRFIRLPYILAMITAFAVLVVGVILFAVYKKVLVER